MLTIFIRIVLYQSHWRHLLCSPLPRVISQVKSTFYVPASSPFLFFISSSSWAQRLHSKVIKCKHCTKEKGPLVPLDNGNLANKLSVQKQMVRVIQIPNSFHALPLGKTSRNQHPYIYFKCFIQAFEFCEIGFLNSKNFQLRREKASTIRKGKLFKFCFSTDNHLIVGMGKFFAFSDFINKILSRINTKSNNSDTHSLWAINESVTLGHLNDDVFRWNLKMNRQLTFF